MERVRNTDGRQGAGPLRMHEHREARGDARPREHLRPPKPSRPARFRRPFGLAPRRGAARAVPVPRGRRRVYRPRRRSGQPAGGDGRNSAGVRRARGADRRRPPSILRSVTRPDPCCHRCGRLVGAIARRDRRPWNQRGACPTRRGSPQVPITPIGRSRQVLHPPAALKIILPRTRCRSSPISTPVSTATRSSTG